MPKKIGKYELGKTLGTGSFSKVKLGIDCENQSQWAIKIIDKDQLAKEHMEEQLKREIAVMKLLKHPNVVQLSEVLQTHKHIYLILELITGGELFDKIVAAKKFTEPIARRYFQMMMCGMRFCHQQGIAHRDLKPENLLLAGDDTLKISDFGLSNLQRGPAGGGGTLLQTVCGTPNYVAPEVLKERGYNGITADIWSCGVILFVMLAGYLPFDDPNMNALFNKIERGEYRMARHFTDPVKDIIGKMLVIEPEKRLSMEGVIAHPWFDKNSTAGQAGWNLGGKIDVSAAQTSGAVSNVQESGQRDSRPSSAAAGASGSMDAFKLIQELTSGKLSASSDVKSACLTKMILSVAGVSNLQQAREKVQAVLAHVKGNPKPGKEECELKGFANAHKGLMTYVCQVKAFIAVQGEFWVFVEMRRGRGDILDFQELWTQFTKPENLGVGSLRAVTSVV